MVVIALSKLFNYKRDNYAYIQKYINVFDINGQRTLKNLCLKDLGIPDTLFQIRYKMASSDT